MVATRLYSSMYLGQVASAGRYAVGQFSSPNTQMMCRTQHFARATMTAPQFIWTNYYGQNETSGGATMTLTASVEYPIGSTPTRITFGGQASASVAAGSAVTSDAIAITIPDGAMFRVWTWQSNANGVLYSQSTNNVDLVQLGATATDRTATGPTGSTTGMSGNQFVCGPAAIIDYTDKPSILILGDSRSAGSGSYTQYGSSDVGNIPRPVGGAFAYINLSIPGASMWQFRDNTTAGKVQSFAAYCSHIVVAGGINDLNGGTSAANMKTLYQQLIAKFNPTGRKPVFVCTVEPYTTSTDSWATVANQTIWDTTKDTERKAHNENIRAGSISGAWGAFDIASKVEDAANPGKWIAPGYTGDGLHGTIKGDIAMSTAVFPGFFGSKAYP